MMNYVVAVAVVVVFVICAVCTALYVAFDFQCFRLKLVALYCQYRMRNHLKTFTQESVIYDLVSCLNATNNKIEKRIKRLEMCLVSFVGLSQEVRELAIDAIHHAKVRLSAGIPDMISTKHIDEMFSSEASDIFQANGLFDEPSFPANAIFNGFAKDIVNMDGKVYDLASMIVVIAYYRLYHDKSSNYSYDGSLIEHSKLIFKGGASIGKFIATYRNGDASRREFFDTFVKGGDNDTCMDFENPNGLSEEVIFHAGQRIMDKFMDHVICVCREYQFEKILTQYTNSVQGHTLTISDQLFRFEDTKRRSFSVFDYLTVDGIMLKRIVPFSDAGSLYFTKSHLDFINKCGRANFYLGRIKKAFLVKNMYHDVYRINAEILDIAILTPYSHNIQRTYQSVLPIRLFSN
jgi:hypothetical protein